MTRLTWHPEGVNGEVSEPVREGESVEAQRERMAPIASWRDGTWSVEGDSPPVPAGGQDHPDPHAEPSEGATGATEGGCGDVGCSEEDAT